MQKITELTVQNFRACRDVTIELSEFTPIVGPNNTGKSTLLSALSWLLEPTTLKEPDFRDKAKPVVVTIKVEGVTAEVLDLLGETHRKKIEPFLKAGTILIRRTCDQPGQAGGKTVVDIWRSDETHPEKGEWVVSPTGIWPAISAMFPEPIRIRAMEDAAEDATKAKTSTTLGKLLSELTEDVVQDISSAYSEAVANIDAIVSADGESRSNQLKEFDSEASRAVAKFFPGVSVAMHIPTPKLEELLKSGTIVTKEDETVREFSALGHGAQRAIQMALIRVLADRKRSSGRSSAGRLLLIDEPELYLHPVAIYLLREALRELSKAGYQVVVTTHSPMLVEESLAASTVIVGKDKEAGTFARPTMRLAINKYIEEARSQASCLFSLTHASEILFSEGVVVAEGRTEKRLLPELFKAATGATLRTKGLALVDIGGVRSIAGTRKILGALGLKSFVIADLDFAFQGAVSVGYLSRDDSDLRACRDIMKSLAGRKEWRVDDGGNFMNCKDGKSASEMYEELAQIPEAQPRLTELHRKLLERDVWIWIKGAIEAHLGIQGKGELIWSDFSEKLQEEGLRAVKDQDAVVHCMARLAAPERLQVQS